MQCIGHSFKPKYNLSWYPKRASSRIRFNQCLDKWIKASWVRNNQMQVRQTLLKASIRTYHSYVELDNIADRLVLHVSGTTKMKRLFSWRLFISGNVCEGHHVHLVPRRNSHHVWEYTTKVKEEYIL